MIQRRRPFHGTAFPSSHADQDAFASNAAGSGSPHRNRLPRRGFRSLSVRAYLVPSGFLLLVGGRHSGASTRPVRRAAQGRGARRRSRSFVGFPPEGRRDPWDYVAEAYRLASKKSGSYARRGIFRFPIALVMHSTEPPL